MVDMIKLEETLDHLLDFLMNVELRLNTICVTFLNIMEFQRDVRARFWILRDA